MGFCRFCTRSFTQRCGYGKIGMFPAADGMPEAFQVSETFGRKIPRVHRPNRGKIMIILTSDGLTSPQIREKIRKGLTGLTGRAVIVTTASPLRERDGNVPVLRAAMEEEGLETVCLDVETENPAVMLSADAAVLIGGDPYVLLSALRRWPHAKAILKEMADHRLLVGISAGSMVLGQSIAFAADIEEGIGQAGDGDSQAEGFCLTDVSIMPHYTAYQTVYPQTDRVISGWSRSEKKKVVPISDGEALVLKKAGGRAVYLKDSGYEPQVCRSFDSGEIGGYVFDLYGTLIDIHTDEGSEELWKKLALFYSYRGAFYEPMEMKETYEMLTDQALTAQWERTKEFPDIQIEDVFAEMYRRKGVDPSDELVQFSGQMFRALSTEYVRLYAGARELVMSLRKAGKKTAVLSNAQRLFTEYEMKRLGIYDLFDEIFLSSDYGVCKPSFGFYRQLFEKTGWNPETLMMVGNDPDCDCRAAKEAGMKTCLIHSNLSPDNCGPDGCDVYLGHMNLPALQRFLQK